MTAAGTSGGWRSACSWGAKHEKQREVSNAKKRAPGCFGDLLGLTFTH